MRQATPFFTGKLNGHPVRFFTSPDQGERFPWPCLDDVIVAAQMDRKSRRTARKLVSEAGGPPSELVATPDGLARDACCTVAYSFVSAMVDLGRVSPSLEREFATLGVAALDAMLPDLSELQRLGYAIAARRNEDGVANIGARS